MDTHQWNCGELERLEKIGIKYSEYQYCPFCGVHLETDMKHQRALIEESNEWNRQQELNAQIRQAKIDIKEQEEQEAMSNPMIKRIQKDSLFK